MLVLADEWRGAGVCEGELLLLHTSIKRTCSRYRESGIELTPRDILESFLNVLGPSGTLLLPLFNFDFAKGVAFDIRHTASHMGALTEVGRLHKGAVRTGHPIYSFAVIGAKANQFAGLNNFSGYGSDSPFALLRQLGGKIASLDLSDQHSMTFYHHVEEMNAVEYRHHKEFTGQYTDFSGSTEQRTYGLFVRNLDQGIETYADPAGDALWEAGLYSGDRPNEGSGLRCIDANQMFDFVTDIIRSGRAKNMLYRVAGENSE